MSLSANFSSFLSEDCNVLIMIRMQKSVHQKDSILHAAMSLFDYPTNMSSLSPSWPIRPGLLYMLNRAFLLDFINLLEVINSYRISMRMSMVINWFELALSDNIRSKDLAVS